MAGTLPTLASRWKQGSSAEGGGAQRVTGPVDDLREEGVRYPEQTWLGGWVRHPELRAWLRQPRRRAAP